jgi:Na+/H+-dicarboxylate symporter
MTKAARIYRALYFQVLVAVAIGITVGYIWLNSVPH